MVFVVTIFVSLKLFLSLCFFLAEICVIDDEIRFRLDNDYTLITSSAENKAFRIEVNYPVSLW